MKTLLALTVLLLSGCLESTGPDPLFDCEILWKHHNYEVPPNDSIFVDTLLWGAGNVSYDTTIVNDSDEILIVSNPQAWQNNATECPE